MSIKGNTGISIVEQDLKSKLSSFNNKELLQVYNSLSENEKQSTIPKRTIQRYKIAHIAFIQRNNLTGIYIESILKSRGFSFPQNYPNDEDLNDIFGWYEFN